MKRNTPFLIYDAAAGSGKTYALVKEYLSLLLAVPKINYYQHLLALTFTNKAVAEMKERIINNLVAFAEISSLEKPPQMLQDISDDLSIEIPMLHDRSKKILKHLLHNYAAFSVETIDTFNHRLIRTFSRDLSLPSNFEVVLDTDALLAEAVDRLIEKTGIDAAISKTLVTFAIEKANDDKSWDISKDIFNAAKLLNNEDDAAHLEQFKDKTLFQFQNFKKELLNKKRQLESLIIREATTLLALLEKHGLDVKSFSGGYFFKHFSKMATSNFDLSFTPKWQQNLGDEPLYTKALLKNNPDMAATMDVLTPEFAATFKKTKKAIFETRFIDSMLKNLTPLSVVNLVSKEFAALQQEQSLVPISQFNALIHEEIRDQPAPFIYERLGERYRHFFIDEFQDTSVMQWQNMIPLLDNSLSQAPTKQDGSLLLVGDVKQSIYRWRGGNPEQFLSLIHGTSDFNSAPSQVENLLTNYRSLEEIINFNNQFFTHISNYFDNILHEKLYKDGNQQLPNVKKGGYVQIEFIDGQDKIEKDEVYAAKTLFVIKELSKQGFDYKDICVLTRRKADGVFLSTYLMEHGIAVISAETLLLKNAAVVQCLLHTLLLSTQPDNAEIKIHILDFLHAHFNIALDKHTFFASFLTQDAVFSEILKRHDIAFELRKVQQTSPYEAAEYIIKQFKLDVVADAYVYGFMDVVFEYQQKPQADMLGFLDFWETKGETASIASSQNTNGVQFMTIHKAKGLEFPAVIFPYATTDVYKEIEPKTWISVPDTWSQDFHETLINYNKGISEYSKEAANISEKRRQTLLLDNFNLLYVTLTRAVEQLYIISEEPKPVKDGLQTFQQLFKAFLETQNKWNETEKVYTFGNMSMQQFGSTKKSTVPIIPHYISSVPEAHNVHIIANQKMLQDQHVQDAIGQGNLFHDTMEQIRHHGDEVFVFEKLRRNNNISEDKIKDIQLKVETVMNAPLLRALFEKDAVVENERDIITKNGYILRPDRINFHTETNSVTILDYKTGIPGYDHEDQLNGYALALTDMGYRIKDKILVYTNETILINKI